MASGEEGEPPITCDYLVVGAGIAGLSFVDTILSENTTATLIIVDRNSRPGGHWTKAYPFVRLHQPSCFYGVNSVPLGERSFDIRDRATGREVLEYCERVRDAFVATGRVTFFFDAEYRFDEKIGRAHV